jgi:Carboxypeptidase regulatory-like domain
MTFAFSNFRKSVTLKPAACFCLSMSLLIGPSASHRHPRHVSHTKHNHPAAKVSPNHDHSEGHSGATSLAARHEQQQQRIAQQKLPQTGAVEGIVRDANGKPTADGTVLLRDLSSGGKTFKKIADANGVFRFIDVPPSNYELTFEEKGYESHAQAEIHLAAGQVIDRNIEITSIADVVKVQPQPLQVPPPANPYPGVLQRLEQPADLQSESPESLPSANLVFQPEPDRWTIAMPDWDRYGIGGERPYARSRTWDPFNRNKLKGDYPIFGSRTFLNLSAVSDTFFDGRRLPTPSGESTALPGQPGFFGKGRQLFVDQVFLISLDLSHGDTSFRPADWRIRITPGVSINYLNVQELGIVNANVARGTARLDSHIGLQEAFAEVKLADLSKNYDFVSVRAGIQQFTSDFRGFIFNESQPGIRFFGNLDSNRWQYNLAYFNFLEKNTNSGINSFALRNQQVILANAYRQDFLFSGYTAQFSVHYNIDQASILYDDNGFLVRPAPIGTVRPHSVHAAYLGWAGDGHIGWLNMSHAFYQAFGNDSFNPLSARPVTIDARMAALELSVDKDWARFKTSIFYASGDGNPSSGRAHGFDSIDDFPEFAGGIFSLWNREGIRLTGTGVLLTSPNSILPDLRSSKDEGQANFVNPGILLVNMGTNLDLTPKLRAFINVNYLEFMRTEPLELLLFQGNIRHSIGFDYSAGVRYRPPLTENITLTAGASALAPGAGFRDIYSGKLLFSVFTDLRFQF